MAVETKKVNVDAFGVMIDHPRNCDVVLQSIPGCRLRSEILASRTVKDAKSGEERIPQDQARHLGMLPQIPGMELHVSPTKRTYRVIDPLHDDEALCERICKAVNEGKPIRADRKLEGVKPHGGTLDVHRIKTLCRELLWLLDAGEARMVKGVRPSMEDVDGLPGRYLLNPGSRVRTSQPRYEDQFEDWVDRREKVEA